MSVEIHQPEIEALIQQRMASGAFQDVEAVLLYALKSAPIPKVSREGIYTGTVTTAVAAVQSLPHKDNIKSEHSSPMRPTSRKSLAQLFEESPFRGMDIEFPRDKSPLRAIDL